MVRIVHLAILVLMTPLCFVPIGAWGVREMVCCSLTRRNTSVVLGHLRNPLNTTAARS
jgi:hypothetical protein